MQASGKLKKILGIKEYSKRDGTKGRKQLFVIEVQNGQYSDDIAFEIMQDTVMKWIEKYKVGDSVTVDFNLKSRAWNDTYITSATAWKIAGEAGAVNASTPATSQPAGETQQIPDSTEQQLPF